MNKKFLSILLSLAMVVTMMPMATMTAFAADSGTKEKPWQIGSPNAADVTAWLSEDGKTLTIEGQGTGAMMDFSASSPAPWGNNIETVVIGSGVTSIGNYAFKNIASVALTLPDGWQGEFPDDYGDWYDAKKVTLTAYPLTVRNVQAQQRWPWNGKVDVRCDIAGPEGAKNVVVTVKNGEAELANFTEEVTIPEEGQLAAHFVWDATTASLADDFYSDNVTVEVAIADSEPKISAKATAVSVDLRTSIALAEGNVTIAGVSYSDTAWGTADPADVTLGWTKVGTSKKGDLKPGLSGEDTTEVELPQKNGTYKLTHSVGDLTSFVEFTVGPTVPVDANGFDYTTDGVTFVPGDYCVVDLTTGRVTEMKNVTSAATFNTDDYKTTKMAFRYVPAGKFKAACAKATGYKDLASNDVTLSAYWIAVFPVTEAQYNAVMGGETTSVKPKESISWDSFRGGDWTGWDGAYANVPAPGDGTFVKALNDKVAAAGCADMFDLCTSFQWERAARAGTRTDYFFSDQTAANFGSDDDFSDLRDYAWFAKNFPSIGVQAVGGKSPNAWGLYDVYGNAYERCLDLHEGNDGLVKDKFLEDYAGASTNIYSNRVIRGGHYTSNAGTCSSVYRSYDKTDTVKDGFGFRLIRKPGTSSITVSKVKIGSPEKDIDNPIYGMAMTATDFFTVATKNFEDTPKLKLEWKQSNSTWGETAPTGITANLNASTKVISIATTATLNAGDYPFRVTNGESEKIDDPEDKEAPYDQIDNPEFVSGAGVLTVDKCSELPAGTPKSKTIKGLINRDGQTGNIDLALLGVTLSGAAIKSFGTETDESNIVTIDTSAKTYAFANTATATTATLELTVSSDNYTDFTYTLTFETVDKTPVTVSGVSMDKESYTYGDTVDYTGTPIAKIGEDSDVTEKIDAWTHTYYQNNGTSEAPNWAQLEKAPANAGSYKLVVAADDDEYAGEQEIKFDIAKKAVKVEGIAVQDKIYNGKKDDAVIVLTDVSFDGMKSGDNLTISGITGTYESADANDSQTVKLNASSQWTLAGTSAANYKLAAEGQPTSVKGKISKVSLIVTAKAKSIKYGEAGANDGVEYSGFVNSETDSVLGGTLAYAYKEQGKDTPYTTTSPVGDYDIIPSGLISNNYAITFVKGKLTVEKADQPAATVSMNGYTYGGTPSTPSLTTAAEDGATVTYYYSTSDATSDGTEWKDITGTTLNAKDYYMYAVIGDTDNYKGYTTASATKFTVEKADQTAPEANQGYSLDKKTMKVTIKEGFELSENNEFTSTISSDTALTNNTTYYIRKVATDNYKASPETSFVAKQTFNITYRDQGDIEFSGTHGDGYPTTHTYGTATELKSPTKTGYTFGGWFTDKECTGGAVTSLGAEDYLDDITLYAKWTANTYTVKFNANKGSGSMTSQNFTYKSLYGY